MNISTHFSALVSTKMAQGRLDETTATRLVSREHRDITVLATALGKTQSSVQFLNTKFANRNPAKTAARAEFQNAVREEMQRTGCDYDRAFNKLSVGNPLFANSEDLDKVRRAAAGAGGVPQFSPALADVFRLPRDLDPSLWEAAWKGNEKDWPAINYAKTFHAIAEKLQSSKGLDIEGAVDAAKKQFPDLFKAVEELSKLSF